MDYNTIAETLEQVKPTSQQNETDAWSLYQAFEHVSDGRKKRCVRYRLALILTLIVLAHIGGRKQFKWDSEVGCASARSFWPTSCI